MCNFISWIEVDKEVFYLTKDDLKGKKFNEYKKYNSYWQEDIMGHGAIEFFYPNMKGKHVECENFSSPKNFPNVIVEDIKKGMFKNIGVCIDILNNEGKKKYKKIQQSASSEYKKIQQSASSEYKKIQQSAWSKYDKIEQPASSEYKKIQQSAWSEYKKIKQSALSEYEKIQQSALSKYKKIQQSASSEYKKIQQSAFWKIAIQKKYRNRNWK